MQLLEHAAKAIAARAGLRVPAGEVARTPEQADAIARRLGGRVAVKAQVPIGGRGRAGGVLVVPAEEASAAAARLLGGAVRGFPVEAVLVESAVEAEQELFLAVALRPATRDLALLVSAAGGVDVEEQAPGLLGLAPIPVSGGLRPWHVWRAALAGGVDRALVPALTDVARRLHDVFWSAQAELVEVNPLFVTGAGELVAGDVRIVPADEAPGGEPATPTEVEFDFLVLNPAGRVGLVTTGAGGSMLLIDLLAEADLAPINFCDIRTGRPRGLAERLSTAFRRLAEMPNLGCIAINVFAGVTLLDELAPVLLDVIRAERPRVPIVARLEGRGARTVRRLLEEAGLRCAGSLDELVETIGEVLGTAPTPLPPHHAAPPLGGFPTAPGAGAGGAGPGVLPPPYRGRGVGGEGLPPRQPNLRSRLDQAIHSGVIVQGMTGQIGRRHTSRMRAYGTPIVAGVTPGRGGTEMDGIPVFDTVAEAVEATGARASIAFLPGDVAADGIAEAAEAGVGLIVCPTEGMRLHAALRALDIARQHGARVIGPNTGGLLVPGRLALGFLPADFARAGSCAVVSRSGTLSYETVHALSGVGLGVSVWIGVGGDRVKGSTFADLVPDLLADASTGALVLLGEIGGTDEEDAADLLAGATLPVVALLAGRTAPQGVAMGHAGAIVNGRRGSYASKREALEAAGVTVVQRPAEVAAVLRARLG